MRLLGLAFFIIPFLISSVAYPRDVKVGNSTMSVSPTAGFCELDETKKADSSWLTSVTNLLKASGVYAIAAFPDCRELQKARKTGEFITSKVYITAPFSQIDKLKPEGVPETCDDLRTREYSDKDKAELAKSVKEFANGNSAAESKALGVLDETKGVVCYVATLQKVKTKAGELSTMLGLFAVTSARNSMLFLYQFTPYVDATSIPTALANLKIVYTEFARANSQ